MAVVFTTLIEVPLKACFAGAHRVPTGPHDDCNNSQIYQIIPKFVLKGVTPDFVVERESII